MKFNSDFYGRNLTPDETFAHVLEHTRAGKWEIIVGTDSQQRKDKLKVVTVIVLIELDGFGNKDRIIFSFSETIKAPHFLAGKIYEEARRSIEVADLMFKYFAENLSDEDVEARAGSGVGIHADIGENGKTRSLIEGIVGYITSAGYKPTIKPDSYVASVIADRLTKGGKYGTYK